MDGYSICQYCGSLCKTCNSPLTCTKCVSSYAPVDGTCTECQVNCLECEINNVTVCTQCHKGFYVNNNDCTACASNCSKCYNATTCVECMKPNMYINSENGTCSECQASCATCANSTACLTCVPNYYKNPLHPDFCVTC